MARRSCDLATAVLVSVRVLADGSGGNGADTGPYRRWSRCGGRRLPASSAAALGGFGGGGGKRLEKREKAVLVEFLQRVASGGLIDLNSLCAVEGVAVWSLYCDVCVLQHDGNLLDASLMAMMLALSRVKLPSVKVAGSGDAGTEATAAGSDDGGRALLWLPRRRYLYSSPPLYPISFGLIADVMVCDPNADEEALISTSLTLLLDGKARWSSRTSREARRCQRGAWRRAWRVRRGGDCRR